MAESTDVSKAGGEATRRGSEAKGSGLCKPKRYDWSEVAHLFENGAVPEELLDITDPVEYNYILVRLKKDFNDKNKSDYIKYMNLQLPYHSRRDELGGVITPDDWSNFVDRLENIIEKVKRRRRRIIRRRKKKGIKKLPRKTLFKPEPKPNVASDPLWREVFIDTSSSDESDAGALSSSEEIARFQEGLRSVGPKTAVQGFQKNAAMLLGVDSKRFLPASQKNAKRNKTMQNAELTSEALSLPPIMRPLLYEDFMEKGRDRSSMKKLRTAEMNLKETAERFPEAKNMLNIKYKDYYHDPFDKEPHKASRMIGTDTST